MAHARDRLASYKRPKGVEIWPELPKSSANKILRRAVRDRVIARQTPDTRSWTGSGDSNVTVSETHLVMHGLAIKKHATPEAVAGIVGLDVEDVRAALGKLVEAKRVVEAHGKYLLAPAARMALDAEYSRLYEDVRAHPDFAAGYEAFERLNGALKRLITEWQTIDVRGEGIPNDHSNKELRRPDHRPSWRPARTGRRRAGPSCARSAALLHLPGKARQRRSKRRRMARSSGSATPRSKAITRSGSSFTRICCA